MIQTARLILTENVAWRSLQLTCVALLLVVVWVFVAHYPLALSHLNKLSSKQSVIFHEVLTYTEFLYGWLILEIALRKAPKAGPSCPSR